MISVTPFLWFDGNAEEAANFYADVFRDASILRVTRSGDGGLTGEGSVLTVEFDLAGQRFVALNGGPEFAFSEATSFQIDVDSQEDIDYYWQALTEDGGEPGRCGWLKDKFGLSWQVVPRILPQLLAADDRASAARVTEALLGMSQLDVAALQHAADGI